MGWWGPIAQKAMGNQPVHHSRPIFAGLLLAAIGAVMVASGVIIALSCAYISRWVVASVAFSICIIAGICFKIGHGRFMKFLEEYH